MGHHKIDAKNRFNDAKRSSKKIDSKSPFLLSANHRNHRDQRFRIQTFCSTKAGEFNTVSYPAAFLRALLSISPGSSVSQPDYPRCRKQKQRERELFQRISRGRVYCTRVTTWLEQPLIITFPYFFPRFYTFHCCAAPFSSYACVNLFTREPILSGRTVISPSDSENANAGARCSPIREPKLEAPSLDTWILPAGGGRTASKLNRGTQTRGYRLIFCSARRRYSGWAGFRCCSSMTLFPEFRGLLLLD